MYLKGLELNGFKSFSSKVYLDFTKGITAIVGPNGSGKSNILDAILWVLGEQSYKSIRAKESQDVIFSGGKNIKARSTASVSLYIDNSDRYLEKDVDEIIIKRSITRDGTNTYSINDERVRLKDISSLLMDTGIGKQAYSVIGQGKVEKIISSSSLELKEIIDEAAGIKKAKTEKAQAIKRLEFVENEIEKIELVENELKNRVEQLSEQSKKAYVYNNYTKNLNVLKYQIYGFYNTFFEKENENLEKDLCKLFENKYDLEKESEDLKTNIDNIQENIKEDENKISDFFEFEKETNKKLQELKDKKLDLTLKKEQFNIDVKNKNEQHEKLNLLLEKLKVDILNIESEEKVLNDKLEESENKSKKLEENIEKINVEKQNIKDRTTFLNESIKDLELEKFKAENKLSDLSQRIKVAKNRNITVNEEKSQALEKLENLKKEFNFENISEKEIEDFEALKSEEEKLIKNRREKQENLENLSIKIRALKNSLENSEAMSSTIKYLNKVALNDKDYIGPFVNQINVDSKYHLAISTIARVSLNDIIVKDLKTAKKYVNILKEKKIGTCSFLPVNDLYYKKLDKKNMGSYVYARDCVKNTSGLKEVDRIIEYVFSNTVITETVDEAVELAKNYKERIVSLTGDVISPSGRLTGGYVNTKIDETLKVKENLLNLEKEYKKHKEEYEKHDKNLSELNLKISNMQNKINEEKQKLQEFETNKNLYLREISTYDFEINDNNEFIAQSEKQIEESKEIIKNCNLEIIKDSDELKDLKVKLDLLSENNEDILELSKLNVEKAVLNEKRSNVLKEKMQKNSEKEQYDKENSELLDFLNNKDKIYENIKLDIENFDKNIDKIDLENKESKEKIEFLYKNISKLNEQKEKLVKQKNDKDLENLNMLNIYENKKQVYMQNLNELEKYGQKLEEVLEFEAEILTDINYEKIEDISKAKILEKKMAVVEKSRSNLGPVNLSSIEEFESEDKRYRKLLNDKFDLLRSKDGINDLLKDIDEQIIIKFDLAIKEISNNFEYMCRELLNGAKGKVLIQDPDDLINTGIELSVKYKNKPEQSLSLLSGGEKSMLAVSFIMAIFMYKPSPFTFFDEVEAALDENNTKKLIELLSRFDNSQFILITHNKETMKGADRLYGVTMNKEVGQSLIVSVDI